MYKDNAPTISARLYKEPHLVMDIEEVGDKRICAMRGRNPDNPTERVKSENYEQMLELGPVGMANNLTSVSKDNLVLETNGISVENSSAEENDDEIVVVPVRVVRDGEIVVEEIQVSLQCECVGVDGYEDKPRMTLKDLASDNPESLKFIYEIDGELYMIRVRKLTSLETWRLMGFSDEDYYAAAEVNSPTQLYKQAGNSIVKNVLMAIFRQMGIGDNEKT